MKKKILSSLAASALLLTFGVSYTQGAPAIHDGHDDHAHPLRDRTRRGKASHARRRAAKARRRSARRAVSYVCPMHPDVRSRTRGECPKCGMTLVAAKRGAAPAGEGETLGAGVERPAP
jgi:hypothetical protein